MFHLVDINGQGVLPIKHGPEVNSGWIRQRWLSLVRQQVRVVPPPVLWSHLLFPRRPCLIDFSLSPLKAPPGPVSFSEYKVEYKHTQAPLFWSHLSSCHALPTPSSAAAFFTVVYTSHSLTLHLCPYFSEAFSSSCFLVPTNQLLIKHQRLYILTITHFHCSLVVLTAMTLVLIPITFDLENYGNLWSLSLHSVAFLGSTLWIIALSLALSCSKPLSGSPLSKAIV